jgi:hypothetical protein
VVRTSKRYGRRERRRLKNFSRNRPETTNLNHQYAIRRVDMDLSSDAGIVPGWHKAYRGARTADVNCFTIKAVHGSVNDARFTAPVDPTMIAACKKPCV